ncbi:MAG: B12-binding domain-containing radical SAM protein [Planctomycetes bacterium]|nr:B12-binding domain-containing radical SAM protein [Planctomycetota bacterium]
MDKKNAVLVSYIYGQFQDDSPLGLMTISTILRQKYGIKSIITDLPGSSDNKSAEPAIKKFTDKIAADDAILFFGFSTICDTFPRSLSTAKELKRKYPSIPVVFGGPHASIVAQHIIEKYDFIDVVVIGEAELIIDSLIKSLLTRNPVKTPGLLFKKLSSTAQFAPLVPVSDFISIDYSTYNNPKNARLIIDAGRGCPYSCTFCATSEFFKRRFRMKNTNVLIADIKRLINENRITCFKLIHDMFTTSRKHVEEFCSKIIEEKINIKWRCSSRTDRIDKKLLESMYSAGCDEIIFGIETGSQRMQQEIGKNLDVNDALCKVKLACDIGYKVTVSYIIGFPSESRQDLIDTINSVLKLCQLQPGPENLSVGLLFPLPATPLLNQNYRDLAYDGFMHDAICGRDLTEWEREEISSDKSAFSVFYYLKNKDISRGTYKYLYWFLYYIPRFRRLFGFLHSLPGQDLGHLITEQAIKKEDKIFSYFNRYNALDSKRAFIKELSRLISNLSMPSRISNKFLSRLSHH